VTVVLVTGAAGFIGSHVAERLLERGDAVVGADNLTPYYDVELKRARLVRLEGRRGFSFVDCDLADRAATEALFAEATPGVVVHMAAQAGVRYSITDPLSYGQSNLVGFLNVLEGCRRGRVLHLVYASSSSVYGANALVPFSEHHPADHPLNLYAATKKANELMAHAYSHLYAIPATGLRFFTVYGPRGRPDMAYFLFTKAIVEGRTIDVFAGGEMERDFTYIDDIVEGVVRIADHPATGDATWRGDQPDMATSAAPYRIYNIGNQRPIKVLRLIELLEQNLGRKAKMRFLPAQPGEVPITYADVDDLQKAVGFCPDTPIEDGIKRFVDWYVEFYGVAR
jgi:UDP-glucuronate 4-epimerase